IAPPSRPRSNTTPQPPHEQKPRPPTPSGSHSCLHSAEVRLDAIILFLGFLLPLVDPRKQTIADKIMRTVVVKAYAPARAAG
ncbi:MAG: hypothetical protein ACRDWI_17730, partial [Jiangellaceae bacterium]